jgi:hypothetical protein
MSGSTSRTALTGTFSRSVPAHLRENLAAAGLELPQDKLAVLDRIG